MDKATQKISFRVPQPLWQNFKSQTDSLFLNAGPLLDYVIARELPQLRVDLGTSVLSAQARRYISGQLKKLTGRDTAGPAPNVNIRVRPSTVSALDEAVEAHNLVRDAFLCRVVIFLRSTDSLLKHLGVPTRVAPYLGSATGRSLGLEDMPTSPLMAIEAVRDDPFYYLRAHVQDNWDCGLYRVQLPSTFAWAACYLEDQDVRGTKANKGAQKLWDEILGNPTKEKPLKRDMKRGVR
ncbi:hypothetical protein [Variovorax sp. J31P207]|uniref:hypothetical protein n=1 Tax=Variovorax sp. J31P207 TaxID=3053510 RepID=UPI0025750D10|nr:hypothetical protein [Variovorax sp. J31P207]MDM0071632.1 hypothetical protein [Variovorax sp. J31P207]